MDERRKEILKRLRDIEPRNYWNTSGKDREYMRRYDDPDLTCKPEKVLPTCKKCRKREMKIQEAKGPAFDLKCANCGFEMLEIYGRITKEPENEWWIDAPEHGYCFWRFVQDRSTPDGKMEPMQQNEIAKYFGCSATKIHFILKQAIAKIKAQGLDIILADFAGADPKGEQIQPDSSSLPEDSED